LASVMAVGVLMGAVPAGAATPVGLHVAAAAHHKAIRVVPVGRFGPEPKAVAAAGPAPAWFEQSLSTSPGPLAAASMAYDGADGEMVLFGGQGSNGDAQDETDVYNGLSWRTVLPPEAPSPVYEASMAYDADTGDIVLFGGSDNGALSGYTYTFNGSIWSYQDISGPSGRYSAAMAYDPAIGEMVLYGGATDTAVVGGTWVYNGTSWTEQPNQTMAWLEGATMAYDQASGQLLLWGGWNGGGYSSNTYVYNGSGWTQLNPTASPPARDFQSMVYDSALGQLVLYGGADGGSFFGDTWTWNGSTWSQFISSPSPPIRDEAAMSYYPGTSEVLLYGGYNGSQVLDDDWVFGISEALTQTSNTIYEVTQGQVEEDLGLEGASLAVRGAAGIVTYWVTSGVSPYVNVSSSGAISAEADTPPGNYFLAGTDQDTVGDSGFWSFDLQVAAAPVLILPGGSVLPGSTVGASYSQQFSAGLSPGPYTFAVTAGRLPPDLSFSSSGLLSGTTTTEGNYSFTITATASEGYGASVSTSIAVAPGLSIRPASLPGATSGYSYAADLTLNGGTGPATFAVAPGSSLPAGLNLSSAGVLSGTPSGTGTASFSVVGTDGDGFSTTASYQMIIEGEPGNAGITISPSSLPTTAIGSQYDEQLSATGGTGPYSWAVTGGDLPEGFSMTSGGLIYGKWNEGESSQFTVTATDSTGASTLTIFELVVQSQGVVISPASLAVPTIDYGQADPQIFTISGGTPPYGWDQVGGSLPYGMSLGVSGSTLTLEGTAQESGTFSFTLNAYDSFDNLAAQTYSLTVNPYPTIIVKPTLLPGKAPIVGVPWSVKLKASGGTAPYNFFVELGALPAGVTLSSTGALKGTPTLADAHEEFAFQVEALDANGYAGYQNYNLYVTTPKIKLAPAVLPDPVVGQAYAQLITASGGGLPYNFTVTAGTLPAGLTLASDGAITGAPTTPGPAAKFTITVSDANGYTKAITYKLDVLGTPTFTSAPLAVVKEKLAKTKISITTTGSYPAPLMTVTGTLPAGLAFKAGDNGAATISGRTTAGPGSYTVTLTANNLAGGTATQTLTIWVYSGQLLPASKLFYQGFKSKYTIKTQIPANLIAITGLPSWLSVEPGAKSHQIVISGTPPSGTPVGTYPATVTVQGLAPPAKSPKFAVIVAV